MLFRTCHSWYCTCTCVMWVLVIRGSIVKHLAPFWTTLLLQCDSFSLVLCSRPSHEETTFDRKANLAIEGEYCGPNERECVCMVWKIPAVKKKSFSGDDIWGVRWNVSGTHLQCFVCKCSYINAYSCEEGFALLGGYLSSLICYCIGWSSSTCIVTNHSNRFHIVYCSRCF